MNVFQNGRAYSFDFAARRFRMSASLTIDGGRVVSIGDEPAGISATRVDLGGATVLPAFADCHVHLAETGYVSGARDLSGARTVDDFYSAVARIPCGDGVVVAGRYDDAAWTDGGVAQAAALERFHADAFALVSRVDGHSCVVNAKTLAWLNLPADMPGIERDPRGEPTGKLFDAANWRAQQAVSALIPSDFRRAAQRSAALAALARGALHLHPQLLGLARDAYADEVAALRSLPVKVYPKICEPDARLARDAGLPYVGGDVFLDGSLGSRTAALQRPYADASGCGSLRFADDELERFFSQADALGISAGVHAIGDAAIAQCVRVWDRVLGGRPSQTGCRHFIEHFECARAEHIAACARLGLVLSMQPSFDATWGGRDGMYRARLGRRRSVRMNALASVDKAGAVLAGGSDSPVCALDPLAGMQAAVDHHQPEQRLSPDAALAAYTVNAAWLAHAERETGNLARGMAADFVVVDGDPLQNGVGFTALHVLAVWRDGKPIWLSAAWREKFDPAVGAG